EALTSYDRAIALQPDSAEAFNNRGMAKLLVGRFHGAWEDYEWRLKTKRFFDRGPGHDVPVWQGEDIAGRRLLICAEPGLGDVIHFARYLPLLAERGGKITLLAQPSLVRLLAPFRSVVHSVGALGKNDAFDFQCALLSLPLRFGTDLQSIPSQIPYLVPE